MKKCTYCGEEIQDIAIKCRYCGEFLEGKSNASNMKVDSAKIIAKPSGCAYPFASLIIPGLGQLLKGQVGKGIIYLGLAVLLGMPTMWVLGVVVAIISAIDASSEVYLCSECKSVVDPSASKCKGCGSAFLENNFSDDIQSIYEKTLKSESKRSNRFMKSERNNE